jgi:hypothetical protein
MSLAFQGMFAMSLPMKATFQWREWWTAERVGVIYASAVSLAMLGGGLALGIATGDWFVLGYGACCALWYFVYCAGWHLLMLAILKVRVRLGLISYQAAPRDQ